MAAEAAADAQSAEIQRLNNRLSQARSQFAKMLEMLESTLDEKRRKEILEQLGRNCARRNGLPAKYKGNPDGFIELMRGYGETIRYDRERGAVSVASSERDCVCGLVDKKITPGYFCDCSVGWQKEIYESLLGKPVNVVLKESVLRGGKRCVFEIRVA
jgi:predicted hydrocarbon binding protein